MDFNGFKINGVKFMVFAILAGILGFLAILIVVVATGQTFGQRCAKVYPEESREWVECIYNLKKGLPAY